MKISLQIKLFLMSFLLVVLTTVSISIAYYTLTKKDAHRESQQRIQIAFDIIADDIAEQLQRYRQNVDEFLQRDNSLAMAVQISGRQTIEKVSLRDLILVQLAEVANISSADRLTLYGVEQQLLLIYQPSDAQKADEAERGGEAGDTPASFSPGGDLPDAISSALFSEGQELGIRIIAPLVQSNNPVGVLVGNVVFRQDMVERYTSLSHTEINFFAGEQFSLGSLPAQSRLSSDSLSAMISCEDLHNEAQDLEVFPVRFDEHDYYQGQCVLRNARGALGAITVSLSQDIEQQAMRKIGVAILIIAACVSAGAFGLTVVLSRKSIRFIQQLITYIARLSQGGIPQKIRAEYKGEFNEIKNNLNALIEATHTTTRIAEEIASGNLSITVKKRSEQDRLMHALHQMVQRLHEIWQETDGMIHAVQAGNLDISGQSGAFEGDWRQLIEGINILIRELSGAVADNAAVHQEMKLARQIQTALLPSMTDQRHPDFEIASLMLPAEEVGGDYYDIMLDNEGYLWLGIGDVTGHGMTPGLIMMMAQTAHTTITSNYHCTPCEVVTKINKVLYMNVHGRLGENHFMTFTVLKYLGEGRFQYAGAHLDLVVYRRQRQVCERIETPGVWLNFVPDIAYATENSEFTLDIGDVLVLYTDGLTEVWDSERKMLDIHGFIDIVRTHAEKEIDALRDAIITDVMAWCNHIRNDDMSLVVVRRRG